MILKHPKFAGKDEQFTAQSITVYDQCENPFGKSVSQRTRAFKLPVSAIITFRCTENITVQSSQMSNAPVQSLLTHIPTELSNPIN